MSWCLRRVQGALRYECSSGASCEMMGANGTQYPDERDREKTMRIRERHFFSFFFLSANTK